MLTRRQLLKTGLAGAALLGVARLAYGPIVPDGQYAVPEVARFKVLDAESRTALAAIGRVMLKGALPQGKAEFDAALQAVVQGCDTAISGLPGTVQDEVKELLSILNGRLSRRWLVGVMSPWDQAGDDEIAHFLSRWRYSSLSLLRSGYQALHQIVFAAWYGNPQSWVGIGYDGPPKFMEGYWNA
ncbi:hypothetical protein [Chitinimonas koreensis]|uniref:hypothetical protein n=1 Tax=Chitinimonas koreensis TaxID=356302 RepID=UPI0004136562|nr:hypothetical protein [Chitinimonas koreensis]QNM95033.1 hypothetical protein H9L41_14070 [Chitinimonas koreensis]